MPTTASPYFGSASSIECPPAIRQPASAATAAPPSSTRASSSKRQPLARPRDEVQREERRAAHRVHVGERVRRGDAAPVVRVVDDRREEVGGDDDGEIVAEAVDGRVVGGVEADEQVGVGRRRRRARGRAPCAGRRARACRRSPRRARTREPRSFRTRSSDDGCSGARRPDEVVPVDARVPHERAGVRRLDHRAAADEHADVVDRAARRTRGRPVPAG